MKTELEKLIKLQITDTNIRTLTIAIDTVSERRGAIEQEFEARAFSIREIENRRDTANTERLALEKDLAEAKSHLQKAENDLKGSQNQKEYEASMRAADVVQKQIAQIEASLLEKMTTLEEVEKILAERSDEANSIESERTVALQKFDDEVEKQKAIVIKDTKKREDVFKTLPANLASVYGRLVSRSRDGIAVAEVKNNSCSSCFMSLRPQVLLDIKMSGNIINCESCTRILYVLPAAEAKTA